MKKIFISQPMKGKDTEQIKSERRSIIKNIDRLMNYEQYEIMDTVFEDFDGSTPLKYLAKSIMVLADADYAYFSLGWQSARGCALEHKCAVEYGINILAD